MFRVFALVSFAFVVAAHCQGQTRVLIGSLVDASSRPPSPVAKAVVTLLNTSQDAVTDVSGRFQFALPPPLGPGSEVQIAVTSGNLRVYLPRDGVVTVPAPGTRPVQVLLLPTGSKLFLEPAAIEALLAQAAKQPTLVVRHDSEQGVKREPRLKRFLSQWAAEYGFSLEDVEREVKAWGDQVLANREKASVRQRALAEFQAQHFAEAAILFEESAGTEAAALEQIERERKQREDEERSILRRFLDDKLRAAEALAQTSKLEQAARVLESVTKRIDRARYPEWWAEMQLHWGAALFALGSSGEAAQSIRSLRAAVAAYQNALLVYTKESSAKDWVMTQNNLGLAYLELGKRSDGAEARQNFGEAWAALQRAADTKTKDREAHATTLYAFGYAAQSFAGRLSGAGAVEALRIAVNAYTEAVKRYTKQSQPISWAMTQNSLGSAYQDLARWQNFGEAVASLRSALTAYGNALDVYTKESHPQEWAMVRNNMGDAAQNIQSFAKQLNEEVSAQAQRQAVQCYQDALQVYTKESLPQRWALTQHNLGNVYARAAEGLSGAKTVDDLRTAIKAYQNALQVYTKESLPQNWASTQDSLGNALGDLGQVLSGTEAVENLRAAGNAHENALQVHTKESFPRWALIQTNLGDVDANLAKRLSGTEAQEYLVRAITAYENALQVYTKEAFPNPWAIVQVKLAGVLVSQKRWEEAAKVAEKVLAVNPVLPEGLAVATFIYQEGLFHFERAFELAAKRAELGVGEEDFVEAHLTTARFDSCATRAAAVLEKTPMNELRVSLSAIRFACLSAAHRTADRRAALRQLYTEIGGLNGGPPAAGWVFSGVKHFLSGHPAFADKAGDWLQLFDALEQGDLTRAKAALTALDSPE
jgi:tetratricopeptide (TPR) repeat protein